uniref:Uncharacterized protein n=1 Tax=Lepeophtheirus salmonis TaxID=72036 RepID=A0A0K2TG08_LEPSM
MTKIFMRNARL